MVVGSAGVLNTEIQKHASNPGVGFRLCKAARQSEKAMRKLRWATLGHRSAACFCVVEAVKYVYRTSAAKQGLQRIGGGLSESRCFV